MNKENVMVYLEYNEEFSNNDKEIYKKTNDKLDLSNNNKTFELDNDLIKYVDDFKQRLKSETRKEPYIVLLTAILNKKLSEISKTFEEDKKEILNKIIAESLNRSSKNILTNIYSKDIIDNKINSEKVKKLVQDVF